MFKIFFYRSKVFLVSFLLKVIYKLNKKTVTGRAGYKSLLKKNKSIIISVWHGQLLSIFYDLRKENVYAVAGTHSDAELISQVAQSWGWKMIRGSSKENGQIAYKEMLRVLNEPGSILFITPDGPTGPRRIPKPGIVRAAKATSSYIIPTSVFSTKKWEFINWDTFILEKPFGKIFIKYGDYISPSELDNSEEALEKLKGAMDIAESLNLHDTSI